MSASVMRCPVCGVEVDASINYKICACKHSRRASVFYSHTVSISVAVNTNSDRVVYKTSYLSSILSYVGALMMAPAFLFFDVECLTRIELHKGIYSQLNVFIT